VIFIPRGSGTPRDPHVGVKVAIFFAAAALFAAGVALERDTLVGIAAGMLVMAFLLRFFARRPPPDADGSDDPGGDEDRDGEREGAA
jgi:hypothetical protein